MRDELQMTEPIGHIDFTWELQSDNHLTIIIERKIFLVTVITAPIKSRIIMYTEVSTRRSSTPLFISTMCSKCFMITKHNRSVFDYCVISTTFKCPRFFDFK